MGTGKPNGRPSGYTLEIADMICEAIAHGHGLHQMCRDNDNWPSSSMVYRWLDQREEFREAYARARQRQADYLAEEIKDISDNSTDWNKARLQVDTRKWMRPDWPLASMATGFCIPTPTSGRCASCASGKSRARVKQGRIPADRKRLGPAAAPRHDDNDRSFPHRV